MYMRFGFSVAVYSDLGVLLVDEVLSVGNAPFQEKCLAKSREFQSQGVTIVVVSHSMELVEKFCEQAILIDGGTWWTKARPARGSFAIWIWWATCLRWPFRQLSFTFSCYGGPFLASIP